MSTEALEKMLAKGMDNALLRFGLGKGYLDAAEFALAAEHLQRCVEFDAQYSAAWKLLGQAQHVGRIFQINRGDDDCRQTFRQGAFDSRLAIDIELGQVQVTVRIYKRHSLKW